MTPRIIFWCGRSLEPWAPPTLTTTGIGGSETAVVHIAKKFAEKGYRVDVYNGAERFEGVYDGVGYFDPGRLRAGEKCDVLVSWRNPGAYQLPVEAKTRLCWLHDLNYGPGAGPDLAKFDRVMGVSQWHADHLAQTYDLTNVDYVPNGIDLSRFGEVKKVPFRVVYGSSPDRGLKLLLALWPLVVAVEPEATLHIAYGWENIDKRIANGDQHFADLKRDVTERIDAMPSVTWRGRLPQDELARFYGEAWVWAYPSDFLEVSCITAMEAMAGGAVPVTSAAGALKETIGDAGYVVGAATDPDGRKRLAALPHSRAWQEVYVSVLRGVLCEANARLTRMHAGRERAKQFTWDASAERWFRIVDECLQKKETA